MHRLATNMCDSAMELRFRRIASMAKVCRLGPHCTLRTLTRTYTVHYTVGTLKHHHIMYNHTEINTENFVMTVSMIFHWLYLTIKILLLIINMIQVVPT